MKGQAIIEERQRCYCAAIATAVAGVAAAGTAAYSASQQAKAQKAQAQGMQDQLAGNKAGAYGSQLVPPEYEDRVTAPIDRFKQSLATINQIGGAMNTYGIRERNKLAGGGKLWSNVVQKQGQNIQSMMGGNIPTDVQEQINRYVAERSGGAFDPTQPGGYGGGLSQTGSGMARSLGLTSMDIMNKGMSYAPQWAQSVDQFTYKPQDVLRDSGVFQQEAQLQLQRDRELYESRMNQAVAASRPDPQFTGFLNDQARLRTIEEEAEANRMRAMSGLITAGVGGATSIYNAVKPTPAVVAQPTGRQYIPGQGMVPMTTPINRNGFI